jgi:ribosomal protein L37AE/L43A
MRGRKPSPLCPQCGTHPTKRLYIKVNGIHTGHAWFCAQCDHMWVPKD